MYLAAYSGMFDVIERRRLDFVPMGLLHSVKDDAPLRYVNRRVLEEVVQQDLEIQFQWQHQGAYEGKTPHIVEFQTLALVEGPTQ